MLKSSGGLWKTTNFTHPRPNWRPMSDTVLSTSGGSVAFGKNPETLYLGTGDPFDPGVGGYIYTSTDGGETWSAGIKLGPSTVIPDVKVDTSGAQPTSSCWAPMRDCSARPTAAPPMRPCISGG